MSIASEIARLQQAKADLKAAINSKGGNITTERIDQFASEVTALPSPKEEETKTVTPNFANGNEVVTPTSGKVLTQVTVVKDSDLVPENIVKGVNIFGVVGTVETVVELTQAQYDALPEGKTWVINETLNHESIQPTNISFTSNGLPYTYLSRVYSPDGNPPYKVLKYGWTNVYDDDDGWTNEAYRTITFETSPTGELLAWLEANAVLQDGYDDNTYYLIVEGR